MSPELFSTSVILIEILLNLALGTALLKTLSSRRKLAIDINSEQNLSTKLKSQKLDAEAKLKFLENRFSGVFDADSKAKEIITKATTQIEALKSEAALLNDNITNLKKLYTEKKSIYDRLSLETAVFDEKIAFAEMGVYEPHFDFTDSEEYKDEIEIVRAKQKEIVANKSAAICETDWTVDGSRSKGQAMTNRGVRLTLRAFNSECDAAISNARWNNVNAMLKRIDYARTQIDKLNTSSAISISESYYQLKTLELQLTHEYREKQKQEREDRAEASRAAREEQKLIREMEEAEQEETKYQKMLEDARAEAIGAHGAKLEAYSQKIEILEKELAQAHAKVERAQAMAEMTKTGWVYIISNIGSFGPDIIKIGLTRRLDPTERVRELGDASVPFLFDTHAIIYSEDAPALERALHNEFIQQRVNATNMRKEFFKTSLDDVEIAVKKLAPQASFFRDTEAQEYYETLALRNLQLQSATPQTQPSFPESL